MKKTSLRVSNEAVGIAFGETRREVNAIAFSSASAVSIETSYISFDDRFAAQIVLSLALLEEITHDAVSAKALLPVARASPRLFRSKTVLFIWKTSSWILILYQKSPTIYKYYLLVYLTGMVGLSHAKFA